MFSYGRQSIDQDDIQAVVTALQSDWLTQGPAVAQFEAKLGSRFSVPHVTVVSNGTAALHLIGMALGWGPGDLILTSPLTFVASANCALYCGASVDFVDIDSISYTLDPNQLEAKIKRLQARGQKVKAVVATDYAGHPCDWAALREIANRYSLQLVDDACHSLGATYKGQEICAATYVDALAVSFHPVKHITTGEGGAVLTRSKAVHDKVQLLRTHGITKSPEMLISSSGPWHYEMQELGYNYRIPDILCVLGSSQLNKLSGFLERRRAIAAYYDDLFKNDPRVIVPKATQNIVHAYHLYPLQIDFPSLAVNRTKFFERLKTRGVVLQVHYIPVHLHPYYQNRFGFRRGDFPISEAFYEREVSIPMYPSLTLENLKEISKALLESL